MTDRILGGFLVNFDIHFDPDSPAIGSCWESSLVGVPPEAWKYLQDRAGTEHVETSCMVATVVAGEKKVPASQSFT